MSPMPEYSDEDLSPTENKPITNGLSISGKVSTIIEENGTFDDNITNETNEKDNLDSQNGNLNAEVGVEITESVSIADVSNCFSSSFYLNIQLAFHF